MFGELEGREYGEEGPETGWRGARLRGREGRARDLDFHPCLGAGEGFYLFIY